MGTEYHLDFFGVIDDNPVPHIITFVDEMMMRFMALVGIVVIYGGEFKA